MKITTYPDRLPDHPAKLVAGAEPTGRYWISACCTASCYEWLYNGKLYVVGSVAGHGYTCHVGGLDGGDGMKILYMEPSRARHYECHAPGCGCKWDR